MKASSTETNEFLTSAQKNLQRDVDSVQSDKNKIAQSSVRGGPEEFIPQSKELSSTSVASLEASGEGTKKGTGEFIPENTGDPMTAQQDPPRPAQPKPSTGGQVYGIRPGVESKPDPATGPDPMTITDPAPGAQPQDPQQGPSPTQRGGPEATSQTPVNEPVGWNGDKPPTAPDMPDKMPGATEWEVTDEQTVSGQLASNLEKGSPLYEAITQRTQFEAAKSGLKNSLMALSAGEMQVINTALSVSKQDAATFARSAEFNAITKNQFSQAEQAFMHAALLSNQNFNQAKLLQREQIQGALSQIAAEIEGRSRLAGEQHGYQTEQIGQQIEGQSRLAGEQHGYDMQQIGARIQGQARLADQQQDHWLQQSGVMHAQNLEAMELNHVMDIERLGVVQDYTLEQQAFATENQMVLNAQNADLQAALGDRQFLQNLELNEQQFGMQSQLNYQSQVTSMLNTELAAIAQIASTPDISAEQMNQAIADISSRIDLNLDFMASFFNSTGGPAAQAGVSGDPSQDYVYYGEQTGATAGDTGSAGGVMDAPGSSEGGGAT